MTLVTFSELSGHNPHAWGIIFSPAGLGDSAFTVPSRGVSIEIEF